MIAVAWMLCWLTGWLVLPPVVQRWMPPPRHRAWGPIGQRLMLWPLFPTRARLVQRVSRCGGCPFCRWARPSLRVLDTLFWPWFLAVACWEARNWRVLDRVVPSDEPVPGSDEDAFPGNRSES